MGSAASSSRSLRPSPREVPASRVCTEDTAVRAYSNKATADGDKFSGQAGRHRIAYRAPTLGGSREASAEDGYRTRSAEGISEPALQPSSALKPKADTFVRRARSSLVTADGLVNSRDVESTVKQRRRTKKLPSASAMCADDETRSARERPGSAYARSAHSKAASSAAHTSRSRNGRRKSSGREGEQVWSDDEDLIGKLRAEALKRCATRGTHLEARLRNIAQHFRVVGPLSSREVEPSARAISPGDDASRGSGQAGAMKPAPPPTIRMGR